MARADKGRNDIKAKCLSCIWFRTPYQGTSCKQVGVRSRDPVCQSYQNKNPFDFLTSDNPRIGRIERELDLVKLEKKADEWKREMETNLQTRVKLPKAYRRPSDGRDAQQALERSAMERARAIEVRTKAEAERARLMFAKSSIEDEVERLGLPATNTKWQNEALIARATRRVDAVLSRLNQVIGLAHGFDVQMRCILETVQEMTKVHYAVVKASED